jgi:hypothetical protein
MSGFVELQPGDSGSQVQAALNAMNSEQYQAMAQTAWTVANIAALTAIPTYYLVTGKVARVMDSDGLGTVASYSWSGTAWLQIPFRLTVGAVVASASSVTPTGDVFHVTGAAQINTIAGGQVGQQLTLIPDGAFTTGLTGNIAKASTAIVGRALTMTFDGVSWWPSY